MKSRSKTIGTLAVLIGAIGSAGCGAGDKVLDDSGASEVGVELAFPGRTGPRARATISTAHGQREVEFQVIDSLAVLEGDIILGRADDVARSSEPDANENAGIAASTGHSDARFRWPNGYVPFEIDSAFNNPAAGQLSRTDILNVMAEYNAITPYWFHPHTTETDFVRVVGGAGCSSNVGRQGGLQNVTLGNGCTKGNARHELGHALGLWHEQSRSDRSQYVMINTANILRGNLSDFQTYAQQGQDGQDMFAYDYNSIMHYGSYAFSSNGLPTITRRDGTPSGSIINGQRNALTEEDIAGVVHLLVPADDAPFRLVNVNSGKCLDVADASTTNNAWVNQYDCHGRSNQRWLFLAVPGSDPTEFIVINQGSGHCLDIPGGSMDSGVRLQQYSCHGKSDQQFRLVLQYTNVGIGFGFALINANSGKCLDVADGSLASPARVNQYTCHYGPNQLWLPTP